MSKSGTNSPKTPQPDIPVVEPRSNAAAPLHEIPRPRSDTDYRVEEQKQAPRSKDSKKSKKTKDKPAKVKGVAQPPAESNPGKASTPATTPAAAPAAAPVVDQPRSDTAAPGSKGKKEKSEARKSKAPKPEKPAGDKGAGERVPIPPVQADPPRTDLRRGPVTGVLDTVHGKIRIAVNFTVKPDQLAVWETAYPGYTLTMQPGSHEHWWSAAERALAEYQLCIAADQVAREYPGVVAHVGGSEKRLRRFRPKDHVCAPILEPLDALRHSSEEDVIDVSREDLPKDKFSVCRVAAPHAHLNQASVLVFLHSSYYLSAGDMFRAMQQCSSHFALVGVHAFNGNSGKLHRGESRWTRENGLIHMSVASNLDDYHHPDWTSILRELRSIRVDGWVVAAERYRVVGDTELYRLRLVEESTIYQRAGQDQAFRKPLTVETIGVETSRVETTLETISVASVNGRVTPPVATRTAVDPDIFQVGRGLSWPADCQRTEDCLLFTNIVVDQRAFFKTSPRTPALLGDIAARVRRSSQFGSLSWFGRNQIVRIMNAVFEDTDEIIDAAVEHWDVGSARDARFDHSRALNLTAPVNWKNRFAWAGCVFLTLYIVLSHTERETGFVGDVLEFLWTLLKAIGTMCASILEGAGNTAENAYTEAQGFERRGFMQESRATVTDFDASEWALWLLTLVIVLLTWLVYLVINCCCASRQVVKNRDLTEPLLAETPYGRKVPDTCLEGRELKPTKEGASYKPPSIATRECQPGAGFYCIGPIFSLVGIVTRKCVHNETIAIRNRVVQHTPAPDEEAVRGLSSWVDAKIRSLCHPRVLDEPDFEEWLDHMDKGKAEKFRQVDRQELTPKVTSDVFIKREILPPKLATDARVITNRDPTYQCIVGPWIYQVQKHFKEVWGVENPDMAFTSGWTPEQISGWYNQRFDEYGARNKPFRVVENDFSRYDATISVALLKLEQAVYKRFGPSAKVRDLLKAQLNTKGWTPNGGAFRVPGTRKSGDSNTSLGNTILNVLVTKYIIEVKLGARCSIMAIGDDSIVFTDATDEQCAQLPALYRLFGLVATNKVHRPDTAMPEYCSGLFYPKNSHQAFFAPKTGRVLCKIGFTTKTHRLEEQHMFLKGTLSCRRFDYEHIPILGKVTQKMYELLQGPEKIDDTEYRNHGYRTESLQDVDRTAVLRYMSDRYDVTVEQILECESSCVSQLRSINSYVDHPVLRRIIEVDYEITESDWRERHLHL